MPVMHSFETLFIGLSCSLLALGLGGCSASSAPLGESAQPISADSAGAGEVPGACAEGLAPADAPEGFCQVTARGLCFDDGATACACAGCASEQCAIAESFPAQAFCPTDAGGADPGAPGTQDPDAPVSSEPPGGGSDGNVGSGTSPAYPGNGAGCSAPGQADPSAPSAPSEPAACAGGTPQQVGFTPGCDFVAGGLCFDDGELACACAGCDDGCVVLESYPAQVRCQ